MRRSIKTIIFLSAVPFTTATCYQPNGTAVSAWSPTSSIQPCSNDTSSPLSHVCCAVNRDIRPGGSLDDGFTADTCLPNGLCQNIATDSDGNVLYSYWRDFCTDSDWQAGKCLKNVCTGEGQHADDGSASMTPCGDSDTATKWCCGANNTGCCDGADSSTAFNIPVKLGDAIPSSTESSSSTASLESAASSGSGLSTAAKAGIGAGVGVGALAVVGLVAGLLLYRRRRANTYAGKGPSDHDAYEIGRGRERVEVEGVGATSKGYQMVGGRPPVEAEGRAISEIDGAVKYRSEGVGAVAPAELP